MRNATRAAIGMTFTVGIGVALLGASVLPTAESPARDDFRICSVANRDVLGAVRPAADPAPAGKALVTVIR
ncbi:hypothetical protein [Streptomyces sp. YKOK-I1]